MSPPLLIPLAGKVRRSLPPNHLPTLRLPTRGLPQTNTPARWTLKCASRGLAIAQRPTANVSGGRHPNLAAAQRLSQQAWQRIVAAQEANEFDMQGHAQKAKGLLDEANRELKLAAESANRKGK